MNSRTDSSSTQVPLALRPAARVVRSVAGLDELEEGWEALAGDFRMPMLSHAWVRACATAFARVGNLHLIAVAAPDLVALAPLIRSADVVPRLELLGAEELGEPGDLLAADAPALGSLADALVRTGEPIHLKKIPAESPTVEALRRAYRGRGLVICRPHAPSPWLPLDVSWTRPEERFTARRRSDVRRARRIALEAGPVSVEALSPTPAELSPLLEEAFRVEAAGWKGRLHSAVLNDSGRATFFRRYAHAAAGQGLLRLGFLRIGDRAAAMQIGVVSGGRFWLLEIGYDEAFARCSPGTLLMLEMLRHAADRGLRSYEFLGAAETWTTAWTRLTRPSVSVRAYPATSHGLTALTVDVARFGWRKLDPLGGASNGHTSPDVSSADA